jgi:hypothetical protein
MKAYSCKSWAAPNPHSCWNQKRMHAQRADQLVPDPRRQLCKSVLEMSAICKGCLDESIQLQKLRCTQPSLRPCWNQERMHAQRVGH